MKLRFLSKLPAELPSDVINVGVIAVNPASLFANGLQGMSSRAPNLFRRLYTVSLAPDWIRACSKNRRLTMGVTFHA